MDADVGQRKSPRGSYPWYLVGLLWFCGFFNYADRQAINAVFPLIGKEFSLSNFQLGMVGSAFMVVYALSGPIAGFMVDQLSRRTLIASGLAFWSLICAATGTARSFTQLLFYRAIEGLGESFYFPASMTILADYHPPSTRSRAMSIHQTSVYLGTAGGALIAGYLGTRYGWRSPFFALGLIGTAYAVWLYFQIIEPVRGKSDPKPELPDELAGPSPKMIASYAEIIAIPSAVRLLLAFMGANFVATTFLTWTTKLVFDRFAITLENSAIVSTAWPLASVVGALVGGLLADRVVARGGGRSVVQGVGLLVGAPLVVATGLAPTVALTALALLAVGFCKGIYDANIFASLYDVVPAAKRGTAAGLMNTVGWVGGAIAPMAVGYAADYVGIGMALAATSVFYVAAGVLSFSAARLVGRRNSPESGRFHAEG